MKRLPADYRVWRWALRLGTVLLILVALLLGTSRWLWLHVDDYHAELEHRLSAHLQASVSITALEPAWRGWTPLLRLQGLQLNHPRDKTPLASAEQALISVDLLHSLLEGHLALEKIQLEGVCLTLDRETDGTLRFGAMTDRAPPASLQAAAAWLSRIRALDLAGKEVQVRNVHDDSAPLVFRNLQLSLRGDGDSRRLALTAALPKVLGNQLRAVLKWKGAFRDPDTWKGTFYVRGDQLHLARWPLPVRLAAGQADPLEIWGTWRHQRLQRLQGKLSLRHVRLPSLPGIDQLSDVLEERPNIATQFDWQRIRRGWRWYSSWQGSEAKSPLVPSSVALTLQTQTNGGQRRLQGRGRSLRVQDVTAALAPWLDDAQRTRLAGLEPVGQIPELAFRMALPAASQQASSVLPGSLFDVLQQPQERASGRCSGFFRQCAAGKGTVKLPHSYAFVARFQQLAVRPWQGIPGVAGLAGKLTMDQESSRITLDAGAFRLNAPALLRAPLVFDGLTGSLQVERIADGLRIAIAELAVVDGTLESRLRGKVTLFADGSSPLLELALQYRNLEVGQVHQYLPVVLLKPKLRKWLEQALVRGRIPSGRLVFYGRPTDFPFAKGQGLFTARFRVVDAILNYAPDWPRIEALQAELIFRNRSFQLKADSGRIFDVELGQVQARISDMRDAVLRVHGQALGPGATMLRFLRDSPLAQRVAHYVKDMQAIGANMLDLKLRIPLKKKRLITYEGNLDFAGSGLNLPVWQMQLRHIQGNLTFTRAGLSGKDLQLQWQDKPVRVDISTEREPNGDHKTQFRVRGHQDMRSLAVTDAPGLVPYVSGQAAWEALLTLPAVPEAGFALTLTSDLQGVAINLPPPLGKSAPEVRPFAAHARFTPQSGLWSSLRYGSVSHAVLQWEDFPRQLRPSRGELRIDSGTAHLPEMPGVTVVARLPRFKLPLAWPTALQGESQNAYHPFLPAWIRFIEVQLGELSVGGQRFSQVQLKIANRPEAIALEVASESLAGRLYLPVNPRPEAPLGIELQRLALHWNSQAKERGKAKFQSAGPLLLPPLWLAVEHLTLNENGLGKLRVSVVPHKDGRQRVDLKLQSELHQMTITGDWSATAAVADSHLQVKLYSEDLAKTLQVLGYPAPLSEGEAEIELAVEWPAPPLIFSPALLRGTLSLQIAKGQLKDVEPGVGRIVGLFNLASLSRRLQLDFKDLFQQGLGFDRLEGKLRFANGQAYLSELRIEAPSALLEVTGRIGLQDRDYDQWVTVTPQLGSALAIAGAIAGGPAIGAAVFLAGQVLKPGIEQISRYYYSITGSWDEPVIRRIQLPASTGESRVVGNQ